MPDPSGAPGADDGRLDHEIAALVGRAVGSGISRAPDPVNLPMIRHWAAAFEDDNPVYTDADAAAASRFGRLVAPPLMLQTWIMATPVITDAGFVGTLASNSEYDIERYVHLGETISASTVVESVSERKQTRLGPGYFVTWVTTYTDEEGEVVGRQRFRILKFRPPEAGG